MTTTAIIVTGCIIVLGIYDLIVVACGGVGTSISRFMQRSAMKNPVVAFSVGFVCGHIFGYMAPEPIQETVIIHVEDNQQEAAQ